MTSKFDLKFYTWTLDRIDPSYRNDGRARKKPCKTTGCRYKTVNDICMHCKKSAKMANK